MAQYQPYYSLLTESGSGYTVQYCLDFFNKRLRVDDYTGSADSVGKRMTEIAKAHALTKIFIKTRRKDWQSLLSGGWMLEGIYKGYYSGKADAYCMALYLDLERRTSDYWMEEDQILAQVLELPIKPARPPLPKQSVMRIAEEKDAGRMAELYSQVFQTYPTPMNDSSYIVEAMEEGTLFYIIEQAGKLISAASAEINTVHRNAEMTDCATLPAFRSQGLMRLLLHALEEELSARGIVCAYSLSRALSFGMNAVFHQIGYRYYGRLTKNCDIYDKFEDMNLWAKSLSHS